MKNIIASVLVLLVLASCSADQTQSTTTTPNVTAPEHSSQTHASQPMAQAGNITPEMTEEGLPKDLVCMVNNAYMGKKQFPVPFEDKMYYGCCEMCVKTIKNDRSVRVAQDPVTGQEVDKAEAFIAMQPGAANGEVLYFSSEANYQQYLANAPQK